MLVTAATWFRGFEAVRTFLTYTFHILTFNTVKKQSVQKLKFP